MAEIDKSLNADYDNETQDMLQELGMWVIEETKDLREVAIPQWKAIFPFSDSVELKRFLVMFKNNAFEHLSEWNFNGLKFPHGRLEVQRILRDEKSPTYFM